MRKALTRKQREVIDLEIALSQAEKVHAIEVIRARLRSCEVPPSFDTHTPVYFSRPAKYKLPHIRQWRDWIESRRGEFALNGVWHTLCLACGIPIPVSSGTKSVLKTHDRVTVTEGTTNKITVGAIVQWTEITKEIWNLFSQSLPVRVDEQEERVIRLATAKGLGCIPCQMHYKRLEANELGQYRTILAEHTRKQQELDQSIQQYRKACTEYGIAVNAALVSQYGLVDPPKQPTPYILVDPKDIVEECTVAYWRQQ